jgi:hypothetical protein
MIKQSNRSESEIGLAERPPLIQVVFRFRAFLACPNWHCESWPDRVHVLSTLTQVRNFDPNHASQEREPLLIVFKVCLIYLAFLAEASRTPSIITDRW